VVFDSLPGWGTTSLSAPMPSYAELTMGPGPVSFSSVLLAAKGANQVGVIDVRSGTPAPYDCSSAFVDFPAPNAPMSIH
jgi:polygalacturonase